MLSILWGQRLYLFFFNLKTQCPASIWFTLNFGFLTEMWILEKTGESPPPVERGSWPHPHPTLAPPYRILAQHGGCFPAGTRKCWNVRDFSDRNQGSGLCQGRWQETFTRCLALPDPLWQKEICNWKTLQSLSRFQSILRCFIHYSTVWDNS